MIPYPIAMDSVNQLVEFLYGTLLILEIISVLFASVSKIALTFDLYISTFFLLIHPKSFSFFLVFFIYCYSYIFATVYGSFALVKADPVLSTPFLC